MVRDKYVLIVADDRIARAINGRLRMRGYDTAFFQSGMTAANFYRNFYQGIDLVIVGEEKFGRLSGINVFNDLKHSKPDLKVMVLAESSFDSAPFREDIICLLNKTESLERLIKVIINYLESLE